MKRIDFFIIGGLLFTALAIYFPIFYADYFYTDEIVQLWNYKKGTGFNMFTLQGRVITNVLFDWLFSGVHKIEDVRFIRLFSLAGWLLAIPVWYSIIKKVFIKENLPVMLSGLVVLYLICTPVFSISISWASCLELFLANTAGLLSGYYFYNGISYEEGRVKVSGGAGFIAILFGLISLFTYQNGFGCFILPFLVHLLMQPGKWRKVFIGVAAYLFICGLYYVLFKYYLKVNHIEASTRTEVNTNVFGKIIYFFGKVMPGSYHFTWLVNEKSIVGRIVYIVLFGLTILGYRLYLAGHSIAGQVKQIGFILLLLLFAYLPSMIVKENFASNRTLLALNMSVFVFAMITLFSMVRDKKRIKVPAIIISIFFVCNALYNLQVQFLRPVTSEYTQIRKAIELGYKEGIDTVFFIRPLENTFEKKYGITRSWDEFGVPSCFFEWVPEVETRQIVFEKTGDRQLAGKLVIKNWLGTGAYLQSGEQPSSKILFINAENILTGQ